MQDGTNSPNLVYTEDQLRQWQVRCQRRFAALSAVRLLVYVRNVELAGIRLLGRQRDHKKIHLAVVVRVLAHVVVVEDVEEGQMEWVEDQEEDLADFPD